MDGIAVTCLILLALVTGAQITGLILWFRAEAQRTQEARALRTTIEHSLARLLEIESTTKSFGPAIERSSGLTSERLLDVVTNLGTVSRMLGDVGASIGAMHTTISEDARHTAARDDTARASRVALDELKNAAVQSNATGEALVAAISASADQASTIGDDLTKALRQVDVQLHGLRSDLVSATKF